jgi:CubicO group peptidase (beta-lactamase class C family)
MQLAEAGRIDLDASMQRYLPDFTLAEAEAASRITARHLQNQTSGLSRESGIKPVLEERADAGAGLSPRQPARPWIAMSNQSSRTRRRLATYNLVSLDGRNYA